MNVCSRGYRLKCRSLVEFLCMVFDGWPAERRVFGKNGADPEKLSVEAPYRSDIFWTKS